MALTWRSHDKPWCKLTPNDLTWSTNSTPSIEGTKWYWRGEGRRKIISLVLLKLTVILLRSAHDLILSNSAIKWINITILWLVLASRGVDPGGWGVFPLKICRRVRVCFAPHKNITFFRSKLCKFHIIKDERLVSKWKVKLIFRGPYRLSGIGIFECLEIFDVRCIWNSLMAWPDWPRPPDFKTDLRHCSYQPNLKSENPARVE